MRDITSVPQSGAYLSFEVRGSHGDLLAALEPLSAVGDVAGRGLVMVPAARTSQRLTSGADLANGLSWPLLVLCSRGLGAPSVRARLHRRADLSLTAADLVSSSWLHAPRGWSVVTWTG
jgi:hypothetical protein